MPFDGLSETKLDDLAKLKLALNGVQQHWRVGKLGQPGTPNHCAIGWLLVATDWNAEEATRLALRYVFPALPPQHQDKSARIDSIWKYNDRQDGPACIARLFEDAIQLVT
jgi:hypothetical protein